MLARFGDMAAHGVKLELSARVAAVGGGDGVHVQLSDAVSHHFGRAVVTTASSVTARLARAGRPRAASARGRPPSGDRVRVAAAAPATGKYYVTYITDYWVPCTAVFEMSTLVDADRDLRGHTLVYLRATRRPPTRRSAPASCRPCSACTRRSRPTMAFRVSRVRYVFPIPTINYSQRLLPMRTSVPGVFAVNSAHTV